MRNSRSQQQVFEVATAILQATGAKKICADCGGECCKGRSRCRRCYVPGNEMNATLFCVFGNCERIQTHLEKWGLNQWFETMRKFARFEGTRISIGSMVQRQSVSTNPERKVALPFPL